MRERKWGNRYINPNLDIIYLKALVLELYDIRSSFLVGFEAEILIRPQILRGKEKGKMRRRRIITLITRLIITTPSPNRFIFFSILLSLFFSLLSLPSSLLPFSRSLSLSLAISLFLPFSRPPTPPPPPLTTRRRIPRSTRDLTKRAHFISRN